MQRWEDVEDVEALRELVLTDAGPRRPHLSLRGRAVW
jgi:hypothetical protein